MQHPDRHENIHITSHKIKLRTLDIFCKENDINEIDLVKIDTEGSELAVLKGASGLLKQSKINFIQFEFNEMNVVSHSFFREFYDILNGYDLYRLFQNGLVLIKEYSPLHCELFAYQNILAINKALKV